MLKNWDFLDPASNSTIPQINRQKSARNLVVVSMDRQNATATFLDQKKGIQNSCTLERCECSDFNLAGTAPRKTFKPCMHIYRLAMELGLLETKYEDARARETKVVQQKRDETQRLQALPPDASRWGGWNTTIHESGIQKNRQYRAHQILEDEQDSVRRERDNWVVHDYEVTLFECKCEDFVDRHLPCKHIYVVALASGFTLPLTDSEVSAAKARGLENVFGFEEA